jgi:hypothetical protein
MSVALAAGVFLGTDETTGVTITNNSTTTSSEIDILGGATSEGYFALFLKFTSTVTAGTMDEVLSPSRVTGQAYVDQSPVIASFAPINGTQKIPCGSFQTSRYMTCSAKNNATGASATNVTVGYEKIVES